MATFTPPFDTSVYFPSKGDLVRWVFDIWQYLQANPIVSEENVGDFINKYLEEHPVTGGDVNSVNGQKGDVVLTANSIDTKNNISVQDELDVLNAADDTKYSADNPPPYPVTAYATGTQAAIASGAFEVNYNTETKEASFSSGEEAVYEQIYTESHPPDYPVTSVNGKTGAVTGLYDASNPPPYPVTSVNGQTGAVTIETGAGDAYTPSNPPPYPVRSVNGETGNIPYSIRWLGKIENGVTVLPVGTCMGFLTLSGQGALPIGNTASIAFTPSVSGAHFYPIAFVNMSFAYYGCQVSPARNPNGVVHLNITNHGFEGSVDINGYYLLVFLNASQQTLAW